MRIAATVLILASTCIYPRTSSAKESAGDLIQKANAHMEAGELDVASTTLGKAAALAQKKKDLESEVEAAEAFEKLLRKPRRDAFLGTGIDKSNSSSSDAHAKSNYSSLLLKFMKELDPKRLGAISSAHTLARAILEQASETGDNTGVTEAAPVLQRHLTNKHAGKMGEAMAFYGRGMMARTQKDHAASHLALRRALDLAVESGWTRLSILIGTEAAAAAIASGDSESAKKALADVVPVMKNQHYQLTVYWKRVIKHRLRGVSDDVMAPANAFFDTDKRKGSMVGAQGGKGGRGGAGGGADSRSEFGKAYKRLKKKKPFVSVTRTKDGMRLSEHFGPKRTHEQPFNYMMKHWHEDGVAVSFFHQFVCLRMIDMTGRRGGPGGSNEASHAWAFYPLAIGETWGVMKDGTITIRSKKRR